MWGAGGGCGVDTQGTASCRHAASSRSAESQENKVRALDPDSLAFIFPFSLFYPPCRPQFSHLRIGMLRTAPPSRAAPQVC